MWRLVAFQHDFHGQYLPKIKEKLLEKHPLSQKKKFTSRPLARNRKKKHYDVITKRLNFNWNEERTKNVDWTRESGGNRRLDFGNEPALLRAAEIEPTEIEPMIYFRYQNYIAALSVSCRMFDQACWRRLWKAYIRRPPDKAIQNIAGKPICKILLSSDKYRWSNKCNEWKYADRRAR